VSGLRLGICKIGHIHTEREREREREIGERNGAKERKLDRSDRDRVELK